MTKLNEQDWKSIDELLEKGVRHDEIAEIFDVHSVTIARHASSLESRKNKMRQRLDAATQAELERRLAAGEHKKEIAVALNIHWSTVYREARKLAKKQPVSTTT